MIFKSFSFDNVLYKDNSKFKIVEYRNKKFIVVTHEKDENVVVRQSLNKFGHSINVVEDTKVDDILIRKDGNYITTFNSNNELRNYTKSIDFKSISYGLNKNINKQHNVNENIGVIDLETYVVKDVARCYAIELYANRMDDCCTFYIDKDLDSFVRSY